MYENSVSLQKAASILGILLLNIFGFAEVRSEEKMVQAIFERAVYYAASTKYFFKEVGTGELIQINEMHQEARKPDDDYPIVKVPANMLEDGQEGPPGANPAMVGKEFTIHYRADGSIDISGPK